MELYLLGVLSGGFLAFSTGFFRAAGQSAWQVVAIRTAKLRHAQRTRQAARMSRETTASEASRVGAERAWLQAERVGAKFRKRYSADDTGTILTVRSLSESNWREMVSVKEVAPRSRPPTERDGDLPTYYSIEWKVLTKSDAEQRHFTARMIMGSFKDSDGWIEFERLG